VTAFPGPDDRARALAAGFHVHLAKPLQPVDLIRTVEKLGHSVLR
jgi:CheY-like chemotaxis protein